MRTEILVVGGGLFGSVIASALRLDGHEVSIIDARREHAGSKPAACLMKPSWFSSLGKDVYDPSLELLDTLYNVHELEFKVGPAKVGSVLWSNPRHILNEVMLRGEVTSVDRHFAEVTGCSYVPDGRITFRHCIIAAGVWSNELADVPGLRGQAGAAFTWWHEDDGFQSFIRPWAPYRQLVAFKRRADELWVGDGTAIKPQNWTKEREMTSRGRCMKAINTCKPPDRTLFGIRPYVPKAKPAYLKQLECAPNVWVATGGAKNGTLAAGWCAHKLREALSC